MSELPDRYAVIGHPVAHSRSPEIHALFAAQTGERLVYDRLPAEPDAFTAVASQFFAGGGKGLNVTLPFKAEAATFADRLTERAQRAGAVNTLACGDQGRVLGDNTDGVGLLRDLVNNLGVELGGARILILGAGGAVRGVVPVLLGCAPAALCVANRTPAKAIAIAEAFADLGAVQGCALDALGSGWDIVINAISAGLSGEMPTLGADILAGITAAYDMIYADTATPFLRWAAAQGVARRRDGFGMLVEQASESFHLWRGVRPDTTPVIERLRPGGPRYAP